MRASSCRRSVAMPPRVLRTSPPLPPHLGQKQAVQDAACPRRRRAFLTQNRGGGPFERPISPASRPAQRFPLLSAATPQPPRFRRLQHGRLVQRGPVRAQPGRGLVHASPRRVRAAAASWLTSRRAARRRPARRLPRGPRARAEPPCCALRCHVAPAREPERAAQRAAPAGALARRGAQNAARCCDAHHTADARSSRRPRAARARAHCGGREARRG